MAEIQSVINELFDSINSVVVAPVSGIVDQDKEVCKKFVKPDTPVKVVLGTKKNSAVRLIYTEPAPKVSDELIRRLKMFFNVAEKIYSRNPEKFNQTYEVPLTLPTGGVVNLTSRAFEYSYVIYALPSIVLANFDVVYREENTISRLLIETSHPTSEPERLSSRVSIFAVGSPTAVNLFKELIGENIDILDEFSKDLYNLIKSDKFVLPDDQQIDIVNKIVNKKGGLGNDPSFF